MNVLTLKIFDEPQTGIEPNIAGVASVNTDHIVSAMYIPSQHQYILTLIGQETAGNIYYRWFPETKVNKESRQPEPIKDKFLRDQVGEFSGRPISLIVSDDEQIEKVWDFMNPGQPCLLFDLRTELLNKIEQAKQEAITKQEEIKEEMAKVHLVDEHGKPLNKENVGKLVDFAGDTL
jgi:hypothetical protein